MKILIKTNHLSEHLNKVSKALSTKTPSPILTGIKFDVLENGIKLTATDSNILVQTFIPLFVNDEKIIEVEETGSAIIPGKLFLDVIRKVTYENVEISLYEDKFIKIIFGESDFTLNGMDINDYPPVNIMENEKPIIIAKETLHEIIKQTAFTVSTSENRPILTGINFKLENDQLTCVATDSYRLAQKIVNLDKVYEEEVNIVVPGKSLIELERIMDQDNENVYIYISMNTILFKFDNLIFQSRLLEGKYPETTRLIPSDFGLSVTFNKTDLFNVIDRVSLLSREATTNVVKFNVDENGDVVISSNSPEIGRVIEKIKPIKIEGTPIRIAFSAKYFNDSLRAYDSQNVTVFFTGEVRPFIIKGKDDNVTQLVLPVRTE